MHICLIDGTKNKRVYPFGLLKIGNYLKSEGHTVTLTDKCPNTHYDEIWISAIFTFDIPHIIKLAQIASLFADRVIIGGVAPTLLPEKFTGFEIHQGLLPQAEKFSPDYSLLNEPPAYSITRTSYGCIRKCKFCAVSKIEPEFTERDNWINDVHSNTKKLLIYDNNWTAKSIESQTHDIELLKLQTQLKNIDFNQALDCRIFNEQHAQLLSQIPMKLLRFSFDGMYEDGYLQDAIRLAHRYGLKDTCIYMLYNFTDTPQSFYYRLHETAILREDDMRVTLYPMRYRPVFNIEKNHIGKHWTAQMLRNFGVIRGTFSWNGVFAWNKKQYGGPMQNFEILMGSNEDEFLKMLTMNDCIPYIKQKLDRFRVDN